MGYQKLTPIIATGGSTPRYLGDRFADIVNLKDFGAKGDGETDDSTAWAAWQTALQSGGMPFAPAGDYLLDDEVIHIPNGMLGYNTNANTYEDNGQVIESFITTIYIDATNGDDGNSGMSSVDAVQTINNALIRAKKLNTNSVVFVLAAGTYNESVVFDHINGEIVITGNVSINSIRFEWCCFTLKSLNSSYTLTLSNTLYASRCSKIDIDCNVEARVSSGSAFSATHSAFVRIKKQANFYGNFYVGTGAVVVITGSVYVEAVANHYNMLGMQQGFLVVNGSSASFEIKVPSSYTATLGIDADMFSCFWADTGTLKFNGKINTVVFSHSNSLAYIATAVTVSGSVTGKRYSASSLGHVAVVGAGANRIPGSTAGTVTSTSYGLYS